MVCTAQPFQLSSAVSARTVDGYYCTVCHMHMFMCVCVCVCVCVYCVFEYVCTVVDKMSRTNVFNSFCNVSKEHTILWSEQIRLIILS